MDKQDKRNMGYEVVCIPTHVNSETGEYWPLYSLKRREPFRDYGDAVDFVREYIKSALPDAPLTRIEGDMGYLNLEWAIDNDKFVIQINIMNYDEGLAKNNSLLDIIG